VLREIFYYKKLVNVEISAKFQKYKLCKGKPLNVFTNLGIFPTFISILPDFLRLLSCA